MLYRFRSSGWLSSAGLLVLLGIGLTSCAGDGEPARVLTPEATGDGTVAVVGLDRDGLDALRDKPPTVEEWRGVLGVFVADSDPTAVPAMLGRYEIRADTVVFTPRFSFLPGQRYRVVLTCRGARAAIGMSLCRAGADDTIETEFALAAPTHDSPAQVSRVFPTSDTIPENLLKFYVYFSQPMREGDVYRHVRLVDDEGLWVEQGLVETVPELWDHERRRLTLICHPGRIKRGLELNGRLGPPLTAGRRYRLVIDSGLRDALGRELSSGFEKSFWVVAADRQSPDPAAWRVDPPRAGTLEPLRVTLDEPVDHALLARLVTVTTSLGERVEGRVEVAVQETQWKYVPEVVWAEGDFEVVAHPTLEDLAGNRLDGLFDQLADEPVGEPRNVRISFSIKTRAGD